MGRPKGAVNAHPRKRRKATGAEQQSRAASTDERRVRNAVGSGNTLDHFLLRRRDGDDTGGGERGGDGDDCNGDDRGGDDDDDGDDDACEMEAAVASAPQASPQVGAAGAGAVAETAVAATGARPAGSGVRKLGARQDDGRGSAGPRLSAGGCGDDARGGARSGGGSGDGGDGGPCASTALPPTDDEQYDAAMATTWSTTAARDMRPEERSSPRTRCARGCAPSSLLLPLSERAPRSAAPPRQSLARRLPATSWTSSLPFWATRSTSWTAPRCP